MDSESKREENRAFVCSCISRIEKLKASKKPGIHYLALKLIHPKKLHYLASSDGVSNDERKREARDIIQSAVTFDINGNSDPREFWIYLQNIFTPNTPARRKEFTSRLWSLRMEESEKVWDFETRVQGCLWHLRDMGVAIDEKELVSRLVFALPRSWHIVASSFLEEADMLTKDELFKRMRDVEPWNEYRASRLKMDREILHRFPDSRIELQRRLYNLRMQEGEMVPDFFTRVEHLLARLRDMGVDTDEKELNLILISGLPAVGTSLHQLLR